MNKQYRILIYTSNNCAFCNSAKELLINKKLKFEEINISENVGLKEEMCFISKQFIAISLFILFNLDCIQPNITNEKITKNDLY